MQLKNQTPKQTTKTNHLCRQAVFAEWWPTGKHTIWPLEGKLYKSLTWRVSFVSSKNKTTGCTDENSLSWDLKGSPYMETSSPSRLSIDHHDPGIFCLEKCSVILNSGSSKKNRRRSGSTQCLCASLLWFLMISEVPGPVSVPPWNQHPSKLSPVRCFHHRRSHTGTTECNSVVAKPQSPKAHSWGMQKLQSLGLDPFRF